MPESGESVEAGPGREDVSAHEAPAGEASASGAPVGEAAAARAARVWGRVGVLKGRVRAETLDFGERFARAVPREIEAARAEDLRRHWQGFIEERFDAFARARWEAIAPELAALEQEVVVSRDADARAHAARVAAALETTGRSVRDGRDSRAADVGVVALGAIGLGVMVFSSAALGGALALSAPVLAWMARERADESLKRRSIEETPGAVRAAAGRVADLFDARLDEVGARLAGMVGAVDDAADAGPARRVADAP